MSLVAIVVISIITNYTGKLIIECLYEKPFNDQGTRGVRLRNSYALIGKLLLLSLLLLWLLLFLLLQLLPIAVTVIVIFLFWLLLLLLLCCFLNVAVAVLVVVFSVN